MQITRIDPPSWFAGMQDTSLQLLIYGVGLDGVHVSTDIPYTSLEIITNEYYVFLTLCLTPLCQSGRYQIELRKGKESQIVDYTLNQKKKNAVKSSIDTKDVIYLIMTDRFAHDGNVVSVPDINRNDANAWHGGNINGVRNHLDYIQDLGVTALWLTPIFENNMPVAEGGDGKQYSFYHGYACTDFYQVDPHFGNLTDYCGLVQEVHRKGLKVVKDVIFNHCGINHPWIIKPPMKGWFNGFQKSKPRGTNYQVRTVIDSYASKSDYDETVKGWFTESMPDLNLRNKHVLTYLTQMTLWWIEMTDIDAIRMDTYLYSDFRSMQKWQKRIWTEYPQFSIIAETWVSDPAMTAYIQRKSAAGKNNTKHMPIIMDFAFQKQVANCFANTSIPDRAYQLYNLFSCDFLYSSPNQTLAFLDNHDMHRWLYDHDNINHYKQALGLLLTSPRIPQIFYGTELLLSGDGWGDGDGNMRQDFPGGWPDDRCNKFIEEGRTSLEKEALLYTTKLLSWRKNSKAIAYGKMKHFIPQDDVYVYFRTCEEEQVMVLINLSRFNQKINMQRFQEEIKVPMSAIDVITGNLLKWQSLKNCNLIINKNDILILELKNQ